MTPDDMLKFVLESSMLRVIKFGIPLTGLTTLDIGITNLTTAQHELHNSGPLHDILAASCSIPFVFKPVEISGYKYVDGGVIRNMPVEPLLHDTDFIIGSNLMPYGLLPPADISTVISVVWRTFELSIMSNTVPGIDLCDIMIEPSLLNDCNIFNFTKLQEMHDVGYEHTRARLPEIINAIELKRELLEAL